MIPSARGVSTDPKGGRHATKVARSCGGGPVMVSRISIRGYRGVVVVAAALALVGAACVAPKGGGGTPPPEPEPAVVPVVSGGSSSCSVREDGSVVCWGSNGSGQLGDGTTDDNALPFPVLGISNAVDVTVANEHACALLDDESVKCWGNNSNGEFGNGAMTSSSVPVPMAGSSNVVEVAAGGDSHTCAIAVDRSYDTQMTFTPDEGQVSIAVPQVDDAWVECSGSNDEGQAGQSPSPAVLNPTRLTTLPISTATRLYQLGSYQFPYTSETYADARLAAGDDHTCVEGGAGIWCWGDNDLGQLGNGVPSANEFQPVQVSAVNPRVMAAGRDFTCLANVGEVACWGDNSVGQIGRGPIGGSYSTLGSVVGFSGSPAGGQGQIALGTDHACALTEYGGKVECWGGNGSGQLGDGTTTPSGSPVQVVGLPAGVGWDTVSAGNEFTCVDRRERENEYGVLPGMTWCWGSGDHGALGNGTYADSPTPQPLGSGLYIPEEPPVPPFGVTSVEVGGASVCATRTDATLYCVGGTDGTGGLPFGGGQDYSSVPFPAVTDDAAAISLGAPGTGGCVISSAGSLSCAYVDAVPAPGFVPVPEVGTVTDVSDSGVDRCAVDTGSNLWCWGLNNKGQIGDGTTSSNYVPQVVMSNVVDVEVSLTHTCAATTGAELYCWGQNTTGELGVGDLLPHTTPTQVPGLSDVEDISVAVSPLGRGGTCAVHDDGLASCWGSDEAGRLGNGTFVGDTNSPQPVLSSVSEIGIGLEQACALLTNGYMYCWGTGIQAPKPALKHGNGYHTADQLSVGRENTCVRRGDFEVRCSDDVSDTYGFLELVGVVEETAKPAINDLHMGFNNTCVTIVDGTVRCWGASFGQSDPEELPVLSDVVDVGLGFNHACFVHQAGTVSCMGDNEQGQLGNGSHLTPPPGVLVNVVGITDAVEITSAKYSSCVRHANKTVSCWGVDGSEGPGVGGFEGDGRHLSPVLVAGLTGVDQIVSSTITEGYCTRSGTVTDVTCWAMYFGAPINDLPTLIPGTAGKDLTVGRSYQLIQDFACVVHNDDSSSCWGANPAGEWGIPSPTTSPTPIPVHPAGTVSDLAAGDEFMCGSFHDGLFTTNDVQCWGDNIWGQRGANVGIPTIWAEADMPDQFRGHACVLAIPDTVRCWGSNDFGQVGDGTNVDAFEPIIPRHLPPEDSV